ncbi:hypothetical protein J2Z66_006570 [Paenibacillus eucommiae]|uniref:Uncharacterized protein n=1 Tax=Paenibacillus eucommiae TaxID=1355755 RepID=A0ABS4J518_9BACL|nr:hypothetical protein [Paenibacillus eucommiae]
MEVGTCTSAAEEKHASLSSHTNSLKRLIDNGDFTPRIRQIAGDSCWSTRLRVHAGGVVLHLMNRSLEAIPHPVHMDAHNNAVVLKDIKSLSSDNQLAFEVEFHWGRCS